MESTVLETYFRDIKRKTSLLTREQEVELAKRIEKGDIRARNKMIESNLRLAISIAKQYARYGSTLEDLIQESNIGLMKAVEKFDWRKGFKFSTYASWWIKQAVTRSLTSNSTLLKVPSHTLANARKIWQLKQDYIEEFGTEPTMEEICDALDLTEKHVRLAMASIRSKNIASIDQQVGEEGARTLGDIIPDNSSNNIEQILDNRAIREKIIKALSSLSKREELVLRMRFGLDEVLEDDKNVYTINENNEGVNNGNA
jgi:RNA polymerase primary sigma factor